MIRRVDLSSEPYRDRIGTCKRGHRSSSPLRTECRKRLDVLPFLKERLGQHTRCHHRTLSASAVETYFGQRFPPVLGWRR